MCRFLCNSSLVLSNITKLHLCYWPLNWCSGESARLLPLWPRFDSIPVSYVGWFSPCSEGFFLGTLVSLPPQKPTFLNSNSISTEDPYENHCGPGSIPFCCHMWVGSRLAPRVFLWVLWFPFLLKNQHF